MVAVDQQGFDIGPDKSRWLTVAGQKAKMEARAAVAQNTPKPVEVLTVSPVEKVALSKEQLEAYANMDAKLKDNPHAWSSINLPDGRRLLISNQTPRNCGTGPSTSLALTENGYVKVSIPMEDHLSGKGNSWTGEGMEFYNAVINAPKNQESISGWSKVRRKGDFPETANIHAMNMLTFDQDTKIGGGDHFLIQNLNLAEQYLAKK